MSTARKFFVTAESIQRRRRGVFHGLFAPPVAVWSFRQLDFRRNTFIFETKMNPRGLLLLLVFGTVPLLCRAEIDSGKAYGTLQGTVEDQTTKQPACCTVMITDSTGKTVIENESFGAGFRCDGRFSKQLPPGRTRVLVTRGFETRAVEKIIDMPAGGKEEVNVSLERVVDLRRKGWYAGDSHVHMIHGEKTIRVSFDEVALVARAEDLQYLSLAQNWILDQPTPENLTAQLFPRSRPNCTLTWSLEEPKNYYRGDAGRCLGHCWTVGMRGRTTSGEDVVRVLLQASAHDYESDKPTFANFESHRLIHEQGGAVFYTHPARWWTGSWGGQGGYPKREETRISNLAAELPLDTLAGPTFDGVDVMTTGGEFQANEMAFDLWSLLLNHGYRLAGTASSDACFDRPDGATPGVVRTYTYLPDGFSLPGVAKAMAQGRNFITSGPLLLVSAAGQPPGSVFPANGKSTRLEIEAWASGADSKGLSRLEILRNGQPVQTSLFSPLLATVKTNFSFAEAETAWYCVRVFGSDPQRQRAVSGAFFFNGKDYRPPSPVPARIHVILQDAVTGKELIGSVTEVFFHGTLPHAGKAHSIASGDAWVTIPATARLRAEVSGHKPLVKSPILANAALIDFITHLTAEDLLKWETFERTKRMFEETTLVFRLEPVP